MKANTCGMGAVRPALWLTWILAFGTSVSGWGALVAHWKMDGNLNDSVGGYNGSTVGSTSWDNSSQRIGTGCLSLNVSGAYGTVPDNAALRPNNFTVAFWANPSTLSQPSVYSRYLQKGADNYETYNFQWNSGLGVNLSCVGIGVNLSGNFTPVVNTWYHIVGSYDGAFGRLYVNGKLASSTAASGSVSANTGGLNFGARPEGERTFLGKLDDVGLWNQALEAKKIAAIYALGIFEGLDLSDSRIDQFVAAFDAQGSLTINGHNWHYQTNIVAGGSTGDSGGSITGIDAAYVIMDDSGNGMTTQVPTVQFQSTASSGLETVTQAVLNVILTPPGTNTMTVDYAVTGGTASNGVDYVLDPGTLTFAPGETSKAISVQIIVDGLPEPDETIQVTLSNPTGGVLLGSRSNYLYTILDPRPTVQFAQPASTGPKSVTPASIPVVLSAAYHDTVRVDYAVTGGTASNGVDYLLTNGTLSFPSGVLTQAIDVTILGNPQLNYEETVLLTLANPTNATLGDITNHVFTILEPSLLDLKVDFGLPQWGSIDNTTPVPGTVKDGWWGFVANRWADMYMHDAVWERGESAQGEPPPNTDGIAGSGVHVAIDTGFPGEGGLTCNGMCRGTLGGDSPPTGSVVGDPIANTYWVGGVDYGSCDSPSGNMLMRINGLPAGDYELTCYHNGWRLCSKSTRNCLTCDITIPLASVTAHPMPADPATEYPTYTHGWPFPPGTGTGVEMLSDAPTNIPVTQALVDDQVSKSVVRFRTDGSDVLVIGDVGYGCEQVDNARPIRKFILNAFEIKRLPVVRLNVGRSGPDVLLSWPASLINYNLEYRPDLASGSWTAVTNTVTLTNNSWRINVRPSEGAGFYRLRQ